MACGDYSSAIEPLTTGEWGNYMDFVTCGYIESMGPNVWGAFLVLSIFAAFAGFADDYTPAIVITVLLMAAFGGAVALPAPASSLFGLALLALGGWMLFQMFLKFKNP